ncbi:hypothetical protein Bca4012_091379 [Brassica carinata]
MNVVLVRQELLRLTGKEKKEKEWPRKSHRVEADASWDGSVYTRKALASDEDRRYCVAEPGIDRKASAFIAKFHATRVSESERQTISPYQSEKA